MIDVVTALGAIFPVPTVRLAIFALSTSKLPIFALVIEALAILAFVTARSWIPRLLAPVLKAHMSSEFSLYRLRPQSLLLSPSLPRRTRRTVLASRIRIYELRPSSRMLLPTPRTSWTPIVPAMIFSAWRSVICALVITPYAIWAAVVIKRVLALICPALRIPTAILDAVIAASLMPGVSTPVVKFHIVWPSALKIRRPHSLLSG